MLHDRTGIVPIILSAGRYWTVSDRDGRPAAVFYSLIESAKLCGVEPRAYLREAARRADRNPGAVTLARDLKSSESCRKSTD